MVRRRVPMQLGELARELANARDVSMVRARVATMVGGFRGSSLLTNSTPELNLAALILHLPCPPHRVPHGRA